ncbi:porin [Rufibacter immobilis]|uniref:Porin n=1 Tax=Rufibacter immobilis TaxID=1348778 RepID=A0A3M9N5F9_9BACT|nr:porin [Rufibacter immobilis]RNI33040.1 porin [Rufibacter immobilis]
MKKKKYYWLALLLLTLHLPGFTQDLKTDRKTDVLLDRTKGIRILTRDSLAGINLRFRIQSRAEFTTQDGNSLSLASKGGYIKRLRLRTSGFLYNKKLTYSLQLGFSPGDMDVANSDHPQIIRDAVVYYQFTPRLKLGFGQTKLPGNRQRVISSGEQQFVDRSIVNATFTLDRDFGLFASYRHQIGAVPVRLQAALSNGDGRNTSPLAGSGLAYTARAEVLPLGEFTMDGDYFEGDWVREPTPKLSVGIGFSENDNAYRTGGQIGAEVSGFTDLQSAMADLVFKYNGWATYHEWIQREGSHLVFPAEADDLQYVYAGQGYNGQVSYQFPNHFELAGRYSVITPEREIQHLTLQTKQYTVAANYYVNWHRIKLQSDLTYQTQEDLAANTTQDNWILRLQLELGI